MKPDQSKIVNSVSAILQYNDEIYMVKRAPYLRAFPGFLSFPGGKKEEDESDQDTLVRELKEELNFDLALNRNLIKTIKAVGDATAPIFVPYRFTNHFWLVELTEKIDFNIDATEAEWGKWNKISNWINEFEDGLHLIIPPILKILKSFDKEFYIGENLDIHEYYDMDKIPLVPFINNFYILPTPSNTLPPFDTTNAFFINDILVDPSPKDELTLNRLLKTFENRELKAVMLTHHHPDHIQNSNTFAKLKNLPMFLSQDTFNRISRKHNGYFDNINVKIIREDDIVTTWNGENVIVHEVPGHDHGQLALTVPSKKWFIVGDLIQAAGSVVIADPEGDMIEYFSTLKKVIEYNPKIILPSHGLPTSTVYALERTLEHRIEREEQVFKLAQSNKSESEMLELIYGKLKLSELLKLLALKNIESHLKKLKIEKRI
ncbi:MAG: MBL fold metallo-hydrolase [Bacteriovoracaceae bacterium]